MENNPDHVRIVAPCRIHLGLLSVNENEGRRFGGAGVMLDQPALDLRIRRADEDQYRGNLAARTEKFVAHWRNFTGIESPLDFEIVASPPEHVGLGLGTQLGMSVAMGLDSLFGRKDVAISERAASVGRGLRSAVGAYGFHRGGMIVENGKSADQTLGELESHLPLPETWRVMLVRLSDEKGLAGVAEVAAFQSLAQGQSPPAERKLGQILRQEVVPAAAAGDFERFSEHVYQYGFRAGQMFASSQGGPFLNSKIANFVDYCRENGVRGVGQSSWGPTVFCWFSSEAKANSFRSEHLQSAANSGTAVTVTAVASAGAQITVG